MFPPTVSLDSALAAILSCCVNAADIVLLLGEAGRTQFVNRARRNVLGNG